MTSHNHVTKGKKLLPSSITYQAHRPIFIPLFFSDPTKKRQILWQLQLDNGLKDSGKAKRNAINLSSAIPAGTHLLTIIVGDPIISKKQNVYNCNLIIQP
ncbi:hypothetical protein A1D22_00010 [Pasteurellaceae bacterium LFhippo2]|nr:hypothetical protein [Pasteurellaceae bacterium LFhippo2]